MSWILYTFTLFYLMNFCQNDPKLGSHYAHNIPQNRETKLWTLIYRAQHTALRKLLPNRMTIVTQSVGSGSCGHNIAIKFRLTTYSDCYHCWTIHILSLRISNQQTVRLSVWDCNYRTLPCRHCFYLRGEDRRKWDPVKGRRVSPS